MDHITQMQYILNEITGYSIVQGTIQADYEGVWIQPSIILNSDDFVEFEYFDVCVIETTIAQLQAYKRALLQAKTSINFDYNNFDARGQISVVNGATFIVGAPLTGGTSGATGTIYYINENTLYLKDVTGTWQNGEVITDGVGSTSTTSTLTTIIFPYSLNNEILEYSYPVITEYNTSVGNMFKCWIRFDARWEL